MPLLALLDANVLITFDIRDVILRAAEQGICRVRWSEEILAETERNLARIVRGDDETDRAEKAARAVHAMRTAFPGAMIREYQRLIPQMTVNLNDRHVAAAAYRARVRFIVTFNLRHFPDAALLPYRIRAIHPDDFLMLCYRREPETCIEIVRQQARDRRRPVRSAGDILEAMERLAPRFVKVLQTRMEG